MVIPTKPPYNSEQRREQAAIRALVGAQSPEKVYSMSIQN
jgi:hypothetical protein